MKKLKELQPWPREETHAAKTNELVRVINLQSDFIVDLLDRVNILERRKDPK